PACDADAAAEGERGRCARLHVGLGIKEGARHGDDMGGGQARRGETRRLDIADIGIASALHPGEATGLIEHDDLVAKEELRVEAGVEARRAPDVEHRRNDARRLARNETVGNDLPFQPCIGQIGTEGVQPAVEGHVGHSGNSTALSMTTSPKRSMNSAPSTVRRTSTLRLSLSSRWRETSFIAPIVSSARAITGLVTPSLSASPRTVCGGGSR